MVSARGNPTIITGCALYYPWDKRHAWGDLWCYGTGLVLNAVLEPPSYPGDVKAKWFPVEPSPDVRVIALEPNHQVFERRGVIAFDARAALFNLPAYRHILEGIKY